MVSVYLNVAAGDAGWIVRNHRICTASIRVNSELALSEVKSSGISLNCSLSIAVIITSTTY